MGDIISSCMSAASDGEGKKNKKSDIKGSSKSQSADSSSKSNGYAVAASPHADEDDSSASTGGGGGGGTAAIAEADTSPAAVATAVSGARRKLFSGGDDVALLSLAQISNTGFCAGSEEGEVVLFDSSDRRKMHRIKPHGNEVTHLKFYQPEDAATSSFGADSIVTLFSASRDKNIGIISVFEDEQELRLSGLLAGHTLGVTALDVISPRTVVSGSRDNSVRLWDVESQQCTAVADVKLNLVHCVKWMPRLSLVAQGGEDLAIRLWDIRTNSNTDSVEMNLADELTGFEYHPICCDVLPDGIGHTLVVGHNGFNDCGSSVSFWDLRMKKMVRDGAADRAHSNTVRRIVATRGEDGRVSIVSGSDDGTMRLWTSRKNNNNDDDDNRSRASFDIASVRPAPSPTLVASRVASLIAFQQFANSNNNNRNSHSNSGQMTKQFDFVAGFRDGEVSGWRINDKLQQLSKVDVIA